MSHRYAALQNFDESLDIKNSWESIREIRENIKTTAKQNVGYHRLKHNKP
jgi:hypothetical protein